MTVTSSSPRSAGALRPGTRLPGTALILSDGAPEAAEQSRQSIDPWVERVMVLERRADAVRHADTLACDWHDGEATAAAVAAVTTPWLLVLAAGERFVVAEGADLAAELQALPAGPVELTVGIGAEVRVHPNVPGAIAAMGGSGEHRLQSAALDVPLAASTAARGEGMQGAAVPYQPQGNEDLRSAAALSAQEQARELLQGFEEKRLLDVVRRGRDVCWIEDEDEDEPLVTIRIATYNRGQMVVDRAIRSALAQTYRNIEVLVVGDCCDEETERAVLSVSDPRVRFVNLPERGVYPEDKVARWMVAGSAPMNAGRVLARGAWIAPCDDDDELTPDHVEVLLKHAKGNRLEMVYSKASCEVAPGVWHELGSEPLRHGYVTHGSVMYSLGLRFFDHSLTSWKLPEPGDWNLWRRMRDAGVRIGFADHVTYVHYLEGYKRPEAPASTPTAQRLQLGCGPNKLDGWINIDVDPQYQPDVLHDLSSGIPADDSSVDVIYSEHVFEHFPLATGMLLLRESRRVLRPGGVVRIAMPDLTNLVERYQNGWRNQAWLDNQGFAYIDTACHMLNVSLREWGHTYVYDEQDIRLRLEQAGFTSVRRCQNGVSSHPDLHGRETREDSLLIMEAVAP